MDSSIENIGICNNIVAKRPRDVQYKSVNKSLNV